jgi:hypothetical protein
MSLKQIASIFVILSSLFIGNLSHAEAAPLCDIYNKINKANFDSDNSHPFLLDDVKKIIGPRYNTPIIVGQIYEWDSSINQSFRFLVANGLVVNGIGNSSPTIPNAKKMSSNEQIFENLRYQQTLSFERAKQLLSAYPLRQVGSVYTFKIPAGSLVVLVDMDSKFNTMDTTKDAGNNGSYCED